MLAIRMQRTGRSGHAQFRVIVQDSRFSPTRGRVVSYLGSYNPHTKAAAIDSEKAAQYLNNGAQPSDTVARLFKKEGIKLPDWVKLDQPRKRDVRNPDKRRSTAPAQPEAPAEAPAEPQAETETAAEPEAAPDTAAPAEESQTAEDQPAETQAEEAAPAEAEAASEETPAAETSDASQDTEEAPAESAEKS